MRQLRNLEIYMSTSTDLLERQFLAQKNLNSDKDWTSDDTSPFYDLVQGNVIIGKSIWPLTE